MHAYVKYPLNLLPLEHQVTRFKSEKTVQHLWESSLLKWKDFTLHDCLKHLEEQGPLSPPEVSTDFFPLFGSIPDTPPVVPCLWLLGPAELLPQTGSLLSLTHSSARGSSDGTVLGLVSYMVCCLLFQAWLYPSGNARPGQIFLPSTEKCMLLHRVFFSSHWKQGWIYTDLLLHGQTDEMWQTALRPW